MKQSKGHVKFIDGDEFDKIDGRLFRAEIAKLLVDGRRAGQFVTAGSGSELALRLARLAAGQRDYSRQQVVEKK